MCVGIHRSRPSLSPRKDTIMPGCANRLSFCPWARSRTAAAREGLDIQRSELNLFPIQCWVSIENLFGFRSLAQHIGDQVDWNACPTVHGRAAHYLRVRHDHVL